MRITARTAPRTRLAAALGVGLLITGLAAAGALGAGALLRLRPARRGA
ncbi:hypothetical protein NWP10_03780 [Micrococcus sp. HG099]|nr:hypothetical protein [Micrococcus sp. HG099]MCR8674929.1 hypothetical protein [Micrococcus sp. HG099]